eukprot:CAMPEP_0194752766 /NCGR_PEP_ID=MMETSP0323_2-20130528/6653_1 /TAXON_ID=2866 ORGANISM="Crypthecodinium cohnii, Strain Seligo" /NCGR_SAMPLE_ID=MMETSP0323_2 /ASSEMBLY_ACC=CAM_ASM_000346 /LENGTH=60 /DNA_ID=CAMNT_0039670031 /DNA_START=262 /DNA_END=441 /DNA_ORIENTATION=+
MIDQLELLESVLTVNPPGAQTGKLTFQRSYGRESEGPHRDLSVMQEPLRTRDISFNACPE